MSHSGIKLIVGLGNPGVEYERTRHNAGAWFVEALARFAHVSLRFENKFQGLHVFTKLNHSDCHLFIPTTYMNLSGQAVQALAKFYKIPAEAMLIAHDEIDLPVGDIRLKHGGGAGGHNGLTNIIHHLHSQQFYRLRIGVGRPENSIDVADYVLKPPKKTELDVIETSLQKANDVLPLMMVGEYQKAMHQLHTRE